MPKEVAEDAAAQAGRMLHEDCVSPNVAHVNQKMTQNLWVLYHAHDYVLGVLQLLESMHLLRDVAAEQKAEELRIAGLRAFGAQHTNREKAYRTLALRVAEWSGIPGAIERFRLIEEARDDDEYQRLTREFESGELPRLVTEWREQRRLTAEASVQRVRGLLDNKRKTVSMQALREALGAVEEV
jgi:hypothetical protein